MVHATRTVLESPPVFGRISALAGNTYRESLRARILLGLAGAAFSVSLYSLVVGAYTLNNASRVAADLGCASMSAFGIVVAILIMASSLHRELEQKTIFPILARPVSRGEYILGKYAGTLLTIFVFVLADGGLVLTLSAGLGGRSPALVTGLPLFLVAILAIVLWRFPAYRTWAPVPWAVAFFALGLWLAGVVPDERHVVIGNVCLSLFEIGVVTAVATLFASFSTPFLSSLMTLGIFLLGRNADDLARLPARTFGETIHTAGVWLSKVVPNLQVFVPPRAIFVGEVADVRFDTYVAVSGATALGWAVLLLASSIVIFQKRDFL